MSEDTKQKTTPPEAKSAVPPEKAKPAPKAPDPEYVPIADDDVLAAFRAVAGDACKAGHTFVGRRIYDVVAPHLVACCLRLRDDLGFDMLADVTAVDHPDRGARFTLVYNVYSIPRNTRVLLKVEVAEGDAPTSVSGVWPSAEWPEREVFDMFGVRFAGHPDLRRILMPPDWKGFPLRKDYALKGRDSEWVSRHLEMLPDKPENQPREEGHV